MKKYSYVLIAFIGIQLLSFTALTKQAAAQDAQVSYQTFYDELAPYGQWVNDPAYGDVWVPNVNPGFRPYATDGHWVMTDQGNMWVSDEPWSWAAYHYGRWTYNGYYGWVWIPGYEWAPAWVNWRSGGGYYGWAPMGPGQVYGGVYEYPDNYWVFVNPNYLYYPTVYTYYERGDMGMYVHRTEYIRYDGHGGNRYYGPRRADIERVSGHPVEVYHVSNAHEAGSGQVEGHEVNIYRPAVNKESVRTAHPASVQQGNGHPIGSKPEPISADHDHAVPAFRQEQTQHVQQSQQQHIQQQTQQQQRMQPQQQQQRIQPQQQQRMQTQQQRSQPQQQQRVQPQQQQRAQPQQQQRAQPQQQQRAQPQQKVQPKDQTKDQQHK